MKFNTATLGLLGLVASTYAKTYLSEKFDDGDAWTTRWTVSSYREDLGKFNLTAGKWYSDEKASVGIQTSEDLRFYALSAPLSSVFDNKGKDFVVQFTAKHEQKLDCGGGYVKLLPPNYDPKTFNGDTNYNIMFGPDLCGTKSLVHVILTHNDKHLDMKKTISAPSDQFTHVYTFILKPDQTYQVLLDGEEKAAGSILEDWDLLPPKTIPDPEAKKPEDWVDEEKIPDPEDKKPDNWDSIPEFIPDPEAKKPEDWDDEMDGDWEAPSIPNPDYQGEWTPKMIDNPLYKGVWVHPIIDNPEYVVDENIYIYKTGGIGIDVWQVKSGTIFDNFLITDDIALAEKETEDIKALKEKEEESKTAFDKVATEESKETESDAEVDTDVDTEIDTEVDEEFIEETEEDTTTTEADAKSTDTPQKDEL